MSARGPDGNMATAFERSFPSTTTHWIVQRYQAQSAPSVFTRCDCTSYSYLALSVVLFTVGTAITIFALGDVGDGHVLANLGHMWLIGPIFICSGLMVAVKCMLYLRRKSVIQLNYHRRQLLWDLAAGRAILNTGSDSSRPPSYEVITQGAGNEESPPPSYTEAVSLLHRNAANETKAECQGVSSTGESIAESTRHKP